MIEETNTNIVEGMGDEELTKMMLEASESLKETAGGVMSDPRAQKSVGVILKSLELMAIARGLEDLTQAYVKSRQRVAELERDLITEPV